MTIEFRKGANPGPATPGYVRLTVGPDGTPQIVDENGAVTPSATLQGGPIPLVETGLDPSTAADVIAIYNKLGQGLVQRAPSDGAISALGGGGGGTVLGFPIAKSNVFQGVCPDNGNILVPTGVFLDDMPATENGTIFSFKLFGWYTISGAVNVIDAVAVFRWAAGVGDVITRVAGSSSIDYASTLASPTPTVQFNLSTITAGTQEVVAAVTDNDGALVNGDFNFFGNLLVSEYYEV